MKYYEPEDMDRDELLALVNGLVGERAQGFKLAIHMLHKLSVEKKLPYEQVLETDFSDFDIQSMNEILNFALMAGWIKKRRHLELVTK